MLVSAVQRESAIWDSLLSLPLSAMRQLPASYFTHGGVSMSILLSQFVPLSFPQCFHKSFLYVCTSIPVLQIRASVPSRFYIYALIYDIWFFSFWLHSIWQFLGSSTSLWLSSIPFNGWVIFHCIYVPHIYPFICQWASRLLPCLGDCK